MYSLGAAQDKCKFLQIHVKANMKDIAALHSFMELAIRLRLCLSQEARHWTTALVLLEDPHCTLHMRESNMYLGSYEGVYGEVL